MFLVCGVFHKWLGFLFPGPWQYHSGKMFGTPIEEKQLIIRNLPLILVIVMRDYSHVFHDSLSCFL